MFCSSILLPGQKRERECRGLCFHCILIHIKMGTIRGVLLDESLLFAEDAAGNVHFLPGAEVLLHRIQYSKLHVVKIQYSF